MSRPLSDAPDTEPVSFPMQLRVYAETLTLVAASTGLGLLISPRWGTSAVDLLYLLPVLAAATLYGLRPALFAALLSVIAYNFFFTRPLHSLQIHNAADIVTVLMLLVVAVVTSQLAGRMREQARLAAANAARNATIAGFARRLLSCSTANEIAEVSCAELATLLDCNAVVLVEHDEAMPERLASAPTDAPLTPGDIGVAASVLAQGQTAGRGATRLSPADWLFFPVKSGERTLATVGLARDNGGPPVPDERLALLDSLFDQTTLALERVGLEESMRDVAQLRERDRLRGALLSSVSHDLRTPLTAIAAAAAELRRAPTSQSKETVATLETETAKLDRYIANLLDMARIEAGSIGLRLEPVDLVDAVSAAGRDLQRTLDGHELTVDLPSDLPLVRADPHLLHHVLINLIDNAARHGRAGTPILIAAARNGDSVVMTVEDEGPGLAQQKGALHKFAEISGSDRKGGTGLGLAIVKGFSDAMEVEVTMSNRADGAGSSFALRFPARLVVSEPLETNVEPSA
jgi:two-component system, OmpR family, sensor histidine kinase KdpD